MASNNPTVGSIPCPYHLEPVTANVKLSEKKQRLYVHCLSCGLNQPTLPPFQDYIKRNATFDKEYSHLYGDGKHYAGGGEPEPEAQPVPEPEKAPEKQAPAAKTEPKEQPQQVKKPGLLSRLGKALAEEE